MLIYEVNLNVNSDIYDDYKSWLSEHITQMLTFKGFTKANTLETIESFSSMDSINENTKQIVVHYYVESLEFLEEYFEHHAVTMRREGLLKFKNQFTATRRVLNLSF